MTDWREESLQRWDRAAAGWTSTREQWQRWALPVSQWLVEAIHPQPGHRVLELAGGLGDTGMLAAELVKPGGSVIISDGSDEMVQAAAAHGEEIGADNVEYRALQAEWIDLPTATVDGVLCRFGYMLLADPEAALRETRRVIRPGGRVALAVWADADDNPWMTIFRRALDDAGFPASPAPPSGAGPFALSVPEALVELLETAGFDEVEVEPLDMVFEPQSLDAWWNHLSQTSPSAADAIRAMTPAEHYALRDAVDAGYAEYVRDDGSLRVPGRVLVAAATA